MLTALSLSTWPGVAPRSRTWGQPCSPHLLPPEPERVLLSQTEGLGGTEPPQEQTLTSGQQRSGSQRGGPRGWPSSRPGSVQDTAQAGGGAEIGAWGGREARAHRVRGGQGGGAPEDRTGRRKRETRPAPCSQADISGSEGAGQAPHRHHHPSRALPRPGPTGDTPLPLCEETGR